MNSQVKKFILPATIILVSIVLIALLIGYNQMVQTGDDMTNNTTTSSDVAVSGDVAPTINSVFNIPNNNLPEGFFDGIANENTFYGWAVDRDNPAIPVNVVVFIDGLTTNSYLGTFTNRVNRPDVEQELGIQGDFGFNFSIDLSAYNDGQEHFALVYFEDVNNPGNFKRAEFHSGVYFSFRVQNGTLITTEIQPDTLPVGALDGSTQGNNRFAGWAYDPDYPSMPLNVHIYEDGGDLITTTDAVSPRPDVNTAFGITGQHGYVFEIPEQYHNNLVYRIEAFGINIGDGENPILGAGPKAISCTESGVCSNFTGDQSQPLYRFFNTQTGAHFYTSSESARSSIQSDPRFSAFVFEGVSFHTPVEDMGVKVPVYRFYNASTGAHFYTANESQRDTVISDPRFSAFVYEGIGFYVVPETHSNAVPVFRFYNASTGAHFYTISVSDRDRVITDPRFSAFVYEGIAYYGLNPSLNP